MTTTSTSPSGSRGRKGVAKGTIGWPTGAASTLTYASQNHHRRQMGDADMGHDVVPHAFIGVMEQLQHAVTTGTPPALSVADNVQTVALIEAGYKSIAEGRTVKLSEISTN